MRHSPGFALLFAAGILLACTKSADNPPRPDSLADTVAVTPPTTSPVANLIQVAQPQANDIVTSPLVVSGEARGNWYFEASFPVILIDGTGDTLVVKPAQAQGEWMTENFVPFSISLDFTPPSTSSGTLILKKDNASGLPEHDAELRIPVRFKP